MPAKCMLAGVMPFVILAFAITSPLVYAQESTAYRSEALVSGTVRSWGSAQMADLMRLWERGFQRHQPRVRFADKLTGTVSGMGGLYSGVIDLSLMGREIWPTEALAYEQVTGRPPEGVEVAIGSFDLPTKADALVVFVHRENPIASLSFEQLRKAFGCGNGENDSAPRWGEIGATGAWADKPIHVYGYKVDNAAAIFFKNIVLQDSEWRCGIKTFSNQTGKDGKRIDSGELILDALKRDRYGIAISNAHYAGPGVKAVAISAASGSPAVAPTREAVARGAYPLSRAVYIFFNREKGQGLNPLVREFLRYVLSSEGQRDVANEGAYLPLPESLRRQQLEKLH